MDLGVTLGAGPGPGLAVPKPDPDRETGGRGAPGPRADAPPERAPKPPPRKPPPAEACEAPPTKPTPIEKAPIDYPAEARAAGVEGRLILTLHVDADGRVSRVEVVKGVDPRLDGPAVEAARRWRFEPARRCAVPVPATYTLARRFELGA
jgi:protein TonB